MGRIEWQRCVDQLQRELPVEKFDTCIKPLRVKRTDERYELLAPNRYIRDQVKVDYLPRINELFDQQGNVDGSVDVAVEIGGGESRAREPLRSNGTGSARKNGGKRKKKSRHSEKKGDSKGGVNKHFTFETFVEGKSNELAKAAALQVADKSSQPPLQVADESGQPYNPLLLYGGIGLGKTHLMHAVGNRIQTLSPDSNVVYLRSQEFVEDGVDALRNGDIQEFRRFYRSAGALLVDDIQFFAEKTWSQDTFFHIFNGLRDAGVQMVFTCDRYPREVDGLDDRLKSRFVWGLTVEVEPPELETRVAILMEKAQAERIQLGQDVAFFIAERIRSNVRELEGALRRVDADARFIGCPITIDQVKRVLRDLFAIQGRQVNIGKIHRTVAEYYNIKISDILSKRRNRNIARPRQMAMLLAKQLTNHSLPEIGEAFGGRDHTTVLHACRRITELIEEGAVGLAEDRRNLSRLLES